MSDLVQVLTEGAYRRGYQQGVGACSLYVLQMLEQCEHVEEIRKRLAAWDVQLGNWREMLDEQGKRTDPPDPVW
jgi:hypothetical protein